MELKNEYVILQDRMGRTIGATNEWQKVPEHIDYTVYMWGDLIKVKNNVLGKIEFKGSDASEAIQYAANAIQNNTDGTGGGVVFIKNAQGKVYQINNQIAAGGGILFASDNATLDVSNMDDYAFYFDASDMGNTTAKMTGFLGSFFIKGSTSNPNAGFAYFKNVIYGILVRDIHETGVANSLKFEGKGYLALIENSNIGIAADDYGGASATKVQIIGGTPGTSYNKNGMAFINVAIQGRGLDRLLYISDPSNNITFENCWLESASTNLESIYIESAKVSVGKSSISTPTMSVRSGQLRITNSRIGTTINDVYGSQIITTGSWITKQLINQTTQTVGNEVVQVSNCNINFGGAPLIYTEWDLGVIIIDGCAFNNVRGIQIKSTTQGTVATRVVIITNNSFSRGGTTGINYLDIDANHVVISGNTFKLITLDATADIIKVSRGVSVSITDNAFSTNLNPSPPNISVSSTYTVIKNNAGYPTENGGTATFSGDGTTTQFTITHGLVSTPSKVIVTPMSVDAAGDFYVTADDTNIYVNYLTAPTAGTDNVVLSWYAEV